jgi:glycosyltransferase involved in cell wall biosynthesis
MYRESAANLFVSPLHRRVIDGLLAIGQKPPSFLVRPLIDPDQLIPARTGGPRDIERLFLGAFVKAKGSEEILRRWPNGDVTVVGPPTPEALRYPGYRGGVPASGVPSLLARTQKVLLLPTWPEPFGRVAVEAALAGCELEVNSHVGAVSFGLDLADPGNWRGSAEDAWEFIEKTVSGLDAKGRRRGAGDAPRRVGGS